MASYKDILKLIREGKTPQEIRAAVPVPLYRLKRMLCGPRLVAEMETDREFSQRLGRHRLAASMHHVLGRRLEVVDDEDPQTACKAAEKLTEFYVSPENRDGVMYANQKKMQLKQKKDFLKELLAGGGIDPQLLVKNPQTGKWGFEEVVERGENNEPEPVKS